LTKSLNYAKLSNGLKWSQIASFAINFFEKKERKGEKII